MKFYYSFKREKENPRPPAVALKDNGDVRLRTNQLSGQ